jgi:CHAD domain-containing protein
MHIVGPQVAQICVTGGKCRAFPHELTQVNAPSRRLCTRHLRASSSRRVVTKIRHTRASLPAPSPVHLGPAMTAREAFAAIALNCSVHITRSAGFAGRSDDPEAVHQLRVAIRRMRAALSIFQDAALPGHRVRMGDELRALQVKLGVAREWDVLIDDTLSRLPPPLRRDKAVRDLLARTQARRAAAHKSTRAVLRGSKSTDLLRRIHAWIDREFIYGPRSLQNPRWNRVALAQPALAVAAAVLAIYHRRAFRLGRKMQKLDADDLHRLRIRIKKLRYGTEFFGSLWPTGRTRRYVAALKELQQSLGTLHDIAVAPALLARAESPRSMAHSARPELDRWLAKAERAGRKEAARLWRRFTKREPFWEAD